MKDKLIIWTNQLLQPPQIFVKGDKQLILKAKQEYYILLNDNNLGDFLKRKKMIKNRNEMLAYGSTE